MYDYSSTVARCQIGEDAQMICEMVFKCTGVNVAGG